MYLHVQSHKKFIWEKLYFKDGATVASHEFAQLIATYLFSRMNTEGTKTSGNGVNMSKQSFSPWSLLPVRVRPHFQLIPRYSSLFQRILFVNGKMEYRAVGISRR